MPIETVAAVRLKCDTCGVTRGTLYELPVNALCGGIAHGWTYCGDIVRCETCSVDGRFCCDDLDALCASPECSRAEVAE